MGSNMPKIMQFVAKYAEVAAFQMKLSVLLQNWAIFILLQ